jgi:hypothetical protein
MEPVLKAEAARDIQVRVLNLANSLINTVNDSGEPMHVIMTSMCMTCAQIVAHMHENDLSDAVLNEVAVKVARNVRGFAVKIRDGELGSVPLPEDEEKR